MYFYYLKCVHDYQVLSSWSRLPEATVRYSRCNPLATVSQSVVYLSHNSKDLFQLNVTDTEISSAGLSIYEKQMEVSGVLSLGVLYKYEYGYSAGIDGSNLPTRLVRNAELYKVGQRPKFLFRGEVEHKEEETGNEYSLTLSSPRRTVNMATYCHLPDGILRHGWELRWSPESKIAYEIDVENRTSNSVADYVFSTSLSTPLRNMGMTGTLRKTQKYLRTQAEIVWDLQRKESAAKILATWENATQSQLVQVDLLKVNFSQGNIYG